VVWHGFGMVSSSFLFRIVLSAANMPKAESCIIGPALPTDQPTSKQTNKQTFVQAIENCCGMLTKHLARTALFWPLLASICSTCPFRAWESPLSV